MRKFSMIVGALALGAAVAVQAAAPADVVEARHKEYKEMGKAMKETAGSFKSGAPDAALIKANAAIIASKADKIPGWFPVGTGPGVGTKNEAKAEIGYYQPQVGDFPAWAPLADSTEAEKARLGAPLGAPLLRHGGLYASFGHEVLSHDEGIVGSTDPTLIYHEFGTEKMPPRPVLGPAVFKSRKEIERILGRAVVAGILGGEVVQDGVDYFGGHIG